MDTFDFFSVKFNLIIILFDKLALREGMIRGDLINADALQVLRRGDIRYNLIATLHIVVVYVVQRCTRPCNIAVATMKPLINFRLPNWHSGLHYSGSMAPTLGLW